MHKYKAKLLNIVDGDTQDFNIDLGFNIHYKIRVRLNGINTPESRTRDLREKEVGLQAKKFVTEFLDTKREIIVETNKSGKYGRYLAEVYVDGNPLTLALKEAGLARDYNGGKREPWFTETT